MVRLECPLCGVLFHEAHTEPVAGTCSGCGARIEGGGSDARAAVALALEAVSAASDVDAVTRALFAVDTSHPLYDNVRLTSDTREGFYRWWVAIRARDPAALFARLL